MGNLRNNEKNLSTTGTWIRMESNSGERSERCPFPNLDSPRPPLPKDIQQCERIKAPVLSPSLSPFHPFRLSLSVNCISRLCFCVAEARTPRCGVSLLRFSNNRLSFLRHFGTKWRSTEQYRIDLTIITSRVIPVITMRSNRTIFLGI